MLKQIALSIPAIGRLFKQRNDLLVEKEKLRQAFQNLGTNHSNLLLEREMGWPHGGDGKNQTIDSGRNVTEGYFRGQGLEFGPLKGYVLDHPLFKEALELIRGRTLCTLEKIANLFLLITFYLPKIKDGNIIEFGSYRGGMAIFMAFLSKKLNRHYRLYALDTFTGMPESDASKDLHKKGDFADADLNEIQNYARSLNLDNLHLVPGLFEDTFSAIASLQAPFNLVHLDCDIYDSLKYSYNAVKHYMVPGGYLVFDDPLFGTCLGAFQAVEDEVIRKDGLSAEQVYPHLVYRYPPLVSKPAARD